MKIQIPNVTLVAPTGEHIFETIVAIQKCCEGIDFGAVKLITHEKPEDLPENIIFEKSNRMDTYEKYNDYVFRNLTNHVKTSHCLLIQYDSWVIHPEVWNYKWLEYDYIGAPWVWKEDSYIAWSDRNEHVRVGNGGFSIRSKKLLDIPEDNKLHLVQEQGYYNEDGNICCYHRTIFLSLGTKYAPVEVAAKFSYENPVMENFGVKTFGFHKNYPPYKVGE